MDSTRAPLSPNGLGAATNLTTIKQQITIKADAIVASTIPVAAPLQNFLALTRAGDVLYQSTAGTRQLGSLEPLQFDDMFWLASHTKILGAMALLKCIDMGLIGINDSVLDGLPGLAQEEVRLNPNDPSSATKPRVGDITVRNLLTFTAGNAYPVVDILASINPETIITNPEAFFPTNKRVYEGSHAANPNQIWRYGAEADYSGLLVEALTDVSLGQFIQTYLLDPAGVEAKDFTFTLDSEQRARLVGQHVRVSPDMLIPRAPIYDDAHIQFESAGAGGFGTINALGQALLPLINQGVHPKTGKRILSSEIVAQMFTPQLSEAEVENGLNQPSQASNDGGVLFPGTPKQWGLGALLFPEGFETGRGKFTLAWAGFTNVNWHCDIEKGIVVLAWSQEIPQDDPVYNSQTRYPIEKVIYDAIGSCYF
ncbi:beta-lactamase/transpeptidase-like protein [Trichoderma pleuroticola]